MLVMKTRFYVTSGAAVVLMAATVSCTDSNAPLPILEEKTYTGVKELSLNYCGEAMPGKTIAFTPGSDNRATLTLYSKFDLSQLGQEGIAGELPAPGVFPGEARTVLSVALQPGDGCYIFSGSGHTPALSYEYSGKLTSDNLVFDVTAAKLDQLALAGSVWTPAPIVAAEDGSGYRSIPFHVEWDIDPLAGLDIPMSDILELAVTVPCIPVYNNTAYSSLSQLLVEVLKTIAFLPDGNIVATYVSSIGGAYHMATSSGNTVQYIVPGEGSLRLYPNPLAIASAFMVLESGKPAPAIPEELKPSIGTLIEALGPQLAAGVPVAYALGDGTLEVYLDTQTAVPVMSQVIAPLLADEKVGAMLQTELAKYPHLKPYIPQIMEILQHLPLYLEKSSRLEFGLSFHRYSNG